MSAPQGYTRRICAVLLVDVSGYSALVGQDDARTAQAVRELQQAICGIVAEGRGQSEVRAGDSVFATFDSVVVAVDAGLAILRRVNAEQFSGLSLAVRVGIHFGDVLLREDASFNEAVGEAINIAARLQALAKPGTICVSDGVYRHVRRKVEEAFVDLGRQQLKNIADPIHAYLIVPRELGPVHGHGARRMWAWTAGVVLALALAGGAFMYRRHDAAPQRIVGSTGVSAPIAEPAAANSAEQIALGVMVFKSPSDAGAVDWRRDALRDGLNTQLSRLSHVKVYSKEFIDFLISRKGLTEIEAATQLGIRKMLSGSVVASNGTLRIEIHVVDVGTGVLESSYTTSGPEERFLDLQNKLALDVISRLNLPVTDAEKQVLVAQQATDVDALRLLLESERGVAANAPSGAPSEPRSELPGASWWLGSAAFADGGTDAAIRDVLDRYRQAIEHRDLATLGALYSQFPSSLQEAQQRYFDNVRDLRVSIDNVDTAVVGDEAVVSYTRTDDFTDTRTGRQMHVAVRVTKVLRQTDGAWKLTAQ